MDAIATKRASDLDSWLEKVDRANDTPVTAALATSPPVVIGTGVTVVPAGSWAPSSPRHPAR